MQKTAVTISESDEKSARIEGAQQLGVQPDEVTIAQVDAATYTVSMKNAPGQLDIVVQEDKMAATIRAIGPPLGNGKPLTVEDVEQTSHGFSLPSTEAPPRIAGARAYSCERGTPAI